MKAVGVLLVFTLLLGCHGAAHDYQKDIAQSACLALATTDGWVVAVPRACPSAQNCHEVCAAYVFKPEVRRAAKLRTCAGSLHVYADEETGEGIYNYRTCLIAGCGPNFCCCGVQPSPGYVH